MLHCPYPADLQDINQDNSPPHALSLILGQPQQDRYNPFESHGTCSLCPKCHTIKSINAIVPLPFGSHNMPPGGLCPPLPSSQVPRGAFAHHAFAHQCCFPGFTQTLLPCLLFLITHYLSVDSLSFQQGVGDFLWLNSMAYDFFFFGLLIVDTDKQNEYALHQPTQHFVQIPALIFLHILAFKPRKPHK